MIPSDARAHGRENQVGQILEGLARFDFQDESKALAAELFEAVEELADVGLGAHERTADEIRMFDDERQRGAVLFGERGDVDLRFRKIDAFFSGEFLAFRARLGDFDRHRVAVDGANHAADFAVVEPDRIADFGVIQNMRKRNGDLRGFEQLTGFAIKRGPAQCVCASEHERVALLEQQRLRAWGSLPIRALARTRRRFVREPLRCVCWISRPGTK